MKLANRNLALFIFMQLLNFSNQVEDCQVVSGLSEESSCQSSERKGFVKLKSLFIDGLPDPTLVDVPKLFFIETSGRDHLLPRQACAVESASAIHDGENFLIVVVMLTKHLNVESNNATNQIYNKYSDQNLLFRTCTLEEAINNTVLNRPEVHNRVVKSSKKTVHMSDVIRLALLNKFGGWYSDIDTIIMKPLSEFETKMGFMEDIIVSGDTGLPSNGNNKIGNATIIGEGLANGFFKAGKSNSHFLNLTLNLFLHTFNNEQWSSGGSKPMTMALRSICKAPKRLVPFITCGGYFDPSLCPNVRVVDSKYFFLLPWTLGISLYENSKTKQEWIDFFAESYSVDFLSSSLENKQKILRPKYYGKMLPAYAVLGPLYCPLSYHSEKMF